MVPKSGTVCAKGADLHVTDGIVENALEKGTQFFTSPCICMYWNRTLSGLDVGFVTNARITHATPGALYAKGLHRDVEYDGAAKQLGATDCSDIAKQLLSYPASEFKVGIDLYSEHNVGLDLNPERTG
ncbi:hypothetical protein ANCDUO_27538 [Ancylostoma duodenale]|uniref:alkaline phosphatase n=1 Tax=Ancylostoma duodenale TaxID=51022 RepID=A0A0C2BFG4_9BILA|nr:hypothetical protein ANCDUO_27538 [Ancylostoma duodenale]